MLHTTMAWRRWPGFKVDVFVGNMIRYIEDESVKTAKRQIDGFGSQRFLRDPEMEPKQSALRQLLDNRML